MKKKGLNKSRSETLKRALKTVDSIADNEPVVKKCRETIENAVTFFELTEVARNYFKTQYIDLPVFQRYHIPFPKISAMGYFSVFPSEIFFHALGFLDIKTLYRLQR